MKLFLLFLIAGTTFCDEVDSIGDEDQKNWVDPNNPFAGLSSAPPLKSAATPTETCPTQGRLQDDITLRLVIRRLLSQLRVDISTKSAFTRKATLRLSSYDVEVIANYLDLSPASDDLANRERVRSALHSFVYEVDDDSFKPFFEVWLEGMKPWVIMGGLFLIPMGYFFVFRNMIASRSFWGTTIILFVLLSMISVYAGKYQRIMAERVAATLERDGDACAPVGLWQQSFEFMSGLVTFKKKSACNKFMEDQMVPIMFEISLLEVFSDVVSNSIYRWISALGPHLNQFFRTIFDGVPVHGMLLLSAMLIIFFVLMFVRINTFFFTLEPMFVQCLTNVLGLAITGASDSANRQQALEGSQQQSQHNMLETTENLALVSGPATTANSRHRKKERRNDRKTQNSPSKKKDSHSPAWSSATDGESNHSRSRSRGRAVRDITPP